MSSVNLSLFCFYYGIRRFWILVSFIESHTFHRQPHCERLCMPIQLSVFPLYIASILVSNKWRTFTFYFGYGHFYEQRLAKPRPRLGYAQVITARRPWNDVIHSAHHCRFVKEVSCRQKHQCVCLAMYSLMVIYACVSLEWRHNGCNGVSNHQPHDCLLDRSFRPRLKKTSKHRHWPLCDGEFPAEMASNAENVPFDDVIMFHSHSSYTMT